MGEFFIKEYVSNQEKVGLNFERFKITIDRELPEDVFHITYDPRDGLQLYIHEKNGNNLTVQIICTDKRTYLPKKFLEPKTPWYEISSKIREYTIREIGR